MAENAKPAVRPARPFFSSGPCAKRPGWTPEALKNALVGRSHRSKPGKARLKEAIERTRKILGIPADYRIGIVPASDTGAVEMAMWSLLGPRAIDIFAWESFGEDWVTDTIKQLKLKAEVAQGRLWQAAGPESRQRPRRRLPVERHHLRRAGAEWRLDRPRPGRHHHLRRHQRRLRHGRCPGTSSMPPPSPGRRCSAAKRRMASWCSRPAPCAPGKLHAAWPLPKIFRMTKDGKLMAGMFEDDTINTPSMIAVEDSIDALKWAESIGGCKAWSPAPTPTSRRWRMGRARSGWVAFLAETQAIRSNTSVCLKITDPDWFTSSPTRSKAEAAKKITALLDKEGVAYDINSYGKPRRASASGAAPPWKPPMSRPSPTGWTGPLRRSKPPRIQPPVSILFTDHMPKVLIADKLSPAAVAIFKERGVEADVKTGLTKDELLKPASPNMTAIAIRSATKLTAEVIKAAKNLKAVGRAGIGVDNVDIPAATAAGVIVMNTPFGNSITTAEHAIALMLALARELPPPMPPPRPANGRRTASWAWRSPARSWA